MANQYHADDHSNSGVSLRCSVLPSSWITAMVVSVFLTAWSRLRAEMDEDFPNWYLPAGNTFNNVLSPGSLSFWKNCNFYKLELSIPEVLSSGHLSCWRAQCSLQLCFTAPFVCAFKHPHTLPCQASHFHIFLFSSTVEMDINCHAPALMLYCLGISSTKKWSSHYRAIPFKLFKLFLCVYYFRKHLQCFHLAFSEDLPHSPSSTLLFCSLLF